MEGRIYTLNQLKALVLNQINLIKGKGDDFTTFDADEAYEEAVRECGFTHPLDSDESRAKKYFWLMKRMRRWYIDRACDRFMLSVDTGDLKGSQMLKGLAAQRTQLDEEFARAMDNPVYADIFADASASSADFVIYTSGFVTDQLGQDATVAA